MSPQGPEIISQFPKNYFNKDEILEIPMKVIPLNAKKGDFVTIIFREHLIIVSYIFTLKEIEKQRPSLLSLAAVLKDSNINPFTFKYLFESIISQLNEQNITDINLFIKLLPLLFQSFTKGKTEIRITKTFNLKIEVKDITKKSEKRRIKRSKGMW
ncbi:MAG: hypothetical protein ACTSO9_19925 [Candidatus Helarchaeota archaeon]